MIFQINSRRPDIRDILGIFSFLFMQTCLSATPRTLQYGHCQGWLQQSTHPHRNRYLVLNFLLTCRIQPLSYEAVTLFIFRVVNTSTLRPPPDSYSRGFEEKEQGAVYVIRFEPPEEIPRQELLTVTSFVQALQAGHSGPRSDVE